jgi:hypothetical protein
VRGRESFEQAGFSEGTMDEGHDDYSFFSFSFSLFLLPPASSSPAAKARNCFGTGDAFNFLILRLVEKELFDCRVKMLQYESRANDLFFFKRSTFDVFRPVKRIQK